MIDRCLPALSVLNLCLLAVCAALYYTLPELLGESALRLADQRRESILWQQHVRLLQRYADSNAKSSAASSTLDELQVGLQERLDELVIQRQVRVIQADLETLAFDDNIEPLAAHFTTVRLRLGLQIPHAGILLQVLSQLHDNLGDRPAEWVGCSVKRDAMQNTLDANCVLDVYHDNALSGMKS